MNFLKTGQPDKKPDSRIRDMKMGINHAQKVQIRTILWKHYDDKFKSISKIDTKIQKMNFRAQIFQKNNFYEVQIF